MAHQIVNQPVIETVTSQVIFQAFENIDPSFLVIDFPDAFGQMGKGPVTNIVIKGVNLQSQSLVLVDEFMIQPVTRETLRPFVSAQRMLFPGMGRTRENRGSKSELVLESQ